MRRRRGYTAVALLATIPLVLSGCFGRANEQQAGSNEISVWMFPQGDDEVAIRAFEQRFEQANPGKDVKVVVYPEDQYVTKINTALVAGSPPDVAIIESQDWMKAGYVVPLTDKLGEWGVALEDYNPGGMARGELEHEASEGVYGVGTFLGGNVLVYNKKIFDDAGVPHPSLDESMTFQEYADMCRKLAKPDPNPEKNVYGCTMPADIAFNFYPAFGEDGRTAEGNMNSPEFADAFEIGAALINDKLAPSSSVLETITESDLFAQGKIAITWSDFTAVPTYENAGIDFGMTPFFVVEGQEDFVDTWTAPWGTFTDSPHKDDAMKFIQFMATDAQRIQMEVTPDPPLSTKVAEEADYGANDQVKQDFLQVLANARALPFTPPGVETWDPVEVMRLLTIEGQTDAKAILDQMAAASQEEVDAAWERWDTFDKGQFEDQVEAEASAEEE